MASPQGSVLRLLEALHQSPVQLSLTICGAGASAIAALTQVPGCSRTLLTGDVLYSPSAASDALDYSPEHFVSAKTARHLAQHAYHRSLRLYKRELATEQSPPILLGVAATSAVQTSRQRRGKDQAFVSVWGGPLSSTSAPPRAIDVWLPLPKSWTRDEQDEQVKLLILSAIGQFVAGLSAAAVSAGAAGAVDASVWEALLPAGENTCGSSSASSDSAESSKTPPPPFRSDVLYRVPKVDVCVLPAPEARVAVQAVLDGQSPVAVFNRFGEARCDAAPPLLSEKESLGEGRTDAVRLLYPGSFRPLHWGHTELARAALRVAREQRAAGGAPAALPVTARVTYEIAAKIIDKGAVSVDDLLARVQQFTARGERVAVTTASLFVEKAALFPGHGFIVGIDTAVRILDPQYYEGKDEDGMIRALRRDVGDRGCYFVVGGRSVEHPVDLTTGHGENEDRSSRVTWEDLSTLSVPEAIKDLFLGVPENRFRVDISSTELRARGPDFHL